MLRRLLYWIWAPHPAPRGPVYKFSDTLDRLGDVVARHRPDLVDEWDALGPLPISALSDFLDEHFPLPVGSWGTQSFSHSPFILRDMLEGRVAG